MLRLTKTLLIILPLLLLSAAVGLNLLSYEQMLHILKPDVFYVPAEEPAYAVRFFTPERSYQLKWASLLIAGCCLLCSVLLWPYPARVLFCLKRIFRETRLLARGLWKRFTRLHRAEKTLAGITLCAVIVLRLVAITRLEPYGDEEWSYVGFVHQPLLVTITYYPDTNNHILFNLLCKPFDWLFESPLWVMKTPVFLAGILLLIGVFVCVLTVADFTTAFLAATLSGFVFETSFYSLVGRAHIFAALLAAVSSFAVLKWVILPPQAHRWRQHTYAFWFVFTSIAGLYTVPTYIYHVFALLCFAGYHGLVRGQKHLRKPLFWSAVSIGLGTFLCYLPVWMVSGWDALVANRVVKPEDAATVQYALPVQVLEQMEYVFSVHGLLKRGYLYAFAISGVMALLLRVKSLSYPQRQWLLLTLISLVAPFFVMLVLRSFPPYRVFVYLMYILHTGLTLVLVWAVRPLLQKTMHTRLFCIFIAALMVWVSLKSYHFV